MSDDPGIMGSLITRLGSVPGSLYAKFGFRALVALDLTWFGGDVGSVYGATVAHLACL